MRIDRLPHVIPTVRSDGPFLSHAAHALAEGAQELLWPTRCLGCDLGGELLCPDCRVSLPWVAQAWACPNCGAPHGFMTCTECDEAWETRACVSSLPFGGVASRLVTGLKDAHELRLAPVLAALMLCSLDEAASWPAEDGRPRFDRADLDAVCFVPATPQAYLRRGFDHMELVSRSLAAQLGLPLADVLSRSSSSDQRGLGREARASNLAGSIDVLERVDGLSFLLADDVITTGASVRECARALLGRGARSVTACSVARVW